MEALFSEKTVNSLSEILVDLSGYVERTNFLAHLFSDADIIAAENEKCFDFNNSFMITEKLKDWGQNMLHCGSSVEISAITKCSNSTTIIPQDDVENLVISGGNFCRSRLCPVCQKRRSLRVYAQCAQVFASLLAEDFVFLHVVLTVKNCSGFALSREISGLYSGFSRMMKRPELKAWKGVLRCLEVTYSEKLDSFHPHLHCLVAVKKSYFKSRYYVSHDELCRIWKESKNLDYNPSCHIERADFGSIAEVAKYCVKPLELDGMAQSELLYVYEVLGAALHGRRLIQTYGVIRDAFKACRIDLEKDDEDLLIVADRVIVGKYRYNYALHGFEDINDFTI